MLKTLTDIVAASPPFKAELSLLHSRDTRKNPLIFDHVAPASFALIAALIAAQVKPKQPKRIWMIADELPLQERLATEFPLWSKLPMLYLPEQEIHINNGLNDPELAAERLDALRQIAGQPDGAQLIIITTAALKQFVPQFKAGDDESKCHLALGESYPLDQLISKLDRYEFERIDQVTARGEWSMRGGIVDIFPLQSAWPLRLEFFGDELESIRAFDVDSQLSFKKMESADILFDEPPAGSLLEDWIDSDDWVIACPGCTHPGNVLLFETPPDIDIAPEPQDIDQLNSSDELAIFGSPLGNFDSGDFVMQEARRELARQSLLRWKAEKWRVLMYFPHKGEKARFEEICADDAAWSAVQHRDGDLPRGFSIPSAKIAVLSAAEIFGRYTSPHARRAADREERARRERAQAPLREIVERDLVIHASHGLGRFVGIVKDEKSGEEEMHIQYANEILLRIPLNQSHLVSKYIGMGGKTPELSRIGDARWQRACKAAEKAVLDYAAQLLEVQAERDSNSGYAHAADSSWMWQFESSFPYRETPDQLRAINQAKADMESNKPMDRLICGDVGFGKTEVAIRAAFKCVTGGKQAAIMAPTTVLADQHWRTFRARMSEYPIRIELLSRFTKPAKAREVVEGLKNGSVDIVIGTHRLVSKDMAFSNLGLVVIDEEQRFGVRHKEQFKRYFRMVDMLTLSATPIPRTLYVALMGARDMSTIETAPLNRLPVQTAVCPYDEQIIKKAIEREIARGGQVFFLHNRVASIQQMQATLQQLVPTARIVVGHGQMDKGDLEIVMRDFVGGAADILLSTTIIESGIDIPNANTIIIDRADRFGLADLYQLRGRVGRGGHRAYAYLMLPRQALCTSDARKRVNAIKQYTELGSGFKIAMRDLEIRGAGNLLGTQQSGHIAAIGFELYCQLLRQSIERLQGNIPSMRADAKIKADFLSLSEANHKSRSDAASSIGAYIPASYMESTSLRMAAYTQLARVSNTDEIDEIEHGWNDRFSKLPAEARHLLLMHKVRVIASAARISQVEISAQKLMLTRNNDYILIDKRFPRLSKTKPSDKLREALQMLQRL